MGVKKKLDRREATRERKALSAAHIEKSIEKELIERLKSKAYGDAPLNVNEEIWQAVLSGQSSKGKEKENMEDLDEMEDDETDEEDEEEEGEGEEGEVVVEGVLLLLELLLTLLALLLRLLGLLGLLRLLKLLILLFRLLISLAKNPFKKLFCCNK